jgi:polysaccharide export outer membrane protein
MRRPLPISLAIATVALPLCFFSCVQRVTGVPSPMQETVIDKKEFDAAVRKQQPRTTSAPAESGSVAAPSATTASSPDETISPGDVVSISIFEKLPSSQEKRTEMRRIEESGALFIMPIGAVQVGGLSLAQARSTIEDRLREFVVSPYVEIELYKKHVEPQVYVFGEVLKSGTVPLQSGRTLLDAISAAGGCKDDAYRRTITIVREDGPQVRLYTINLYDILKNGKIQENIALKDRDIVFVPKRVIRNVHDVLQDLATVLPWYYLFKTF